MDQIPTQSHTNSFQIECEKPRYFIKNSCFFTFTKTIGVCPCSSFEVYSFANTLHLNSELFKKIIGPYIKQEFPHTKRQTYKKTGSGNVLIQYGADRWTIYDHSQNPPKLLALQMEPSEAVCLSDTMHIEWGIEDPSNPLNALPFTTKKVRHRCKGTHDR